MTNSGLSPLRQAFLALQAAQERVVALEAEKNEAIAIIGVGCRIPGMRDESPRSFWELLEEGRNAVGSGLPARWREVGADSDGVPDFAHHASLLGACDQFDAEFFGIAPREVAGMDPQQRLLLEVSWEALEHAGIAPTSLYGSATGVYVGICTSDYSMLRLATTPLSNIDGHYGSGSAHSVASGRISYVLGLQGPSVSLDTACSSSLVTVHLAIEALRRGECTLALAGGVNMILSTEASRTFVHSGMLSPTGRCSSFSAQADGFVRGEGCGVVVLRRLRDALSSGDRILAVIRGSAVNHDGPSSGLTVPNGLAQQALLRRALSAAGVSPAEVGYVEAHGTGTSLGDPIEAEALGAVLGVGRSEENPLLIGSVKTNVGHLESAAGVAGLIKVVLSLGRGELPGQLHFGAPSPHIRWEQLKLRVVERMQPWAPINGRRIAGVSSFGFSGTNAHVVVEEAPAEVRAVTSGARAVAPGTLRGAEAEAPAPGQSRAVAPGVPSGAESRAAASGAPGAAESQSPSPSERPLEILPLAARTASALRVLAERYRDRLGKLSSGERWADICHTAAVGRAGFAHRLSVRGADAAAGQAGLEAFLTDQPHLAVVKGEVRPGGRPRIGFLFTGQGSHYPGMGAALYAHSPSFRQILERAEVALAGQLPHSLGAVMRGEHPESATLLNQTLYTQPALYVLEYALAELWRSYGVEPVAVLGHSLGEYVGCAVAGVFGFEEGLQLVAERARLMHGLPSDGAMLVVAATEAEIAVLLAGKESEVSLAGVNAARQVTISGVRGAVEALGVQCTKRGWRTHALPVSQGFHSPLMEPIGAALQARAQELRYAAPRLAVISNLTGAPLEQASGEYWRAHMREPVRFKQGLAALRTLGCDVLLEVGPRPVLIQLARQAAAGEAGTPGCRYVTTLKGPGNDEWDALCQAMQELHAAGAELDWAGWNRDYVRRKVDAPSYPFERRRHWLVPSAQRPGRAAEASGGHALLGRRLRSALAGGQFDADVSATGPSAWLADHRIGGQAIMPATGFMETMLAAGQVLRSSWRSLQGLSILAPLSLPETGTRAVQTVVDEVELSGARVRVFAADLEAVSSAAAVGEALRTPRFRLLAEARLAELGQPSAATVNGQAAQAVNGQAAPAVSGQAAQVVSAQAAQVANGLAAQAPNGLAGQAVDGLAGQAADGVAAVRARCAQEHTGAQHYEELALRGAEFGPAFRGVQRLWSAQDEALGEVQIDLPELVRERPHPALLDACLQTAQVLLAGSDTFLPVRLDRFDCYATQWPQRVYVHLRLVRPAPDPLLNFTLLDENDQVLAQVHGLLFQNISHTHSKNSSNSWFYELAWQAAPTTETTGLGIDSWTLVGSGKVAEAIATELRKAGRTVSSCSTSDNDFSQALTEQPGRRGIVYVPPDLRDDASDIGPMAAQDGVSELLELGRLHAHGGTPPNCRLYVVTRAVHAVRPAEITWLADAAISGLAATLFNEFPELRCTRVDIDPADSGQAGRDVTQELLADAPDDWAAWRDGRRFVARLRRAQEIDEPVEPAGPVHLVSDRGLDGLEWRPAAMRALEPHELEIEVRAAPLNFHDVVSVVGLISDRAPLGGECAGVVTRVGPSVARFRPGDAVVAITSGSFATFAVAHEDRTIAKPEGLSFEAACAQGLVYLTADNCLNDVAQMQRGERVLIHAGAGGVGNAAIQLCRRAGVEIYATAGSEAKRTYLRKLGVEHIFSSRSLDFAADIRRSTGGAGVDIVLNSLSGAFVDAGLSLLRPGGRFVEIGKTDIRDSAVVAAAHPGVRYTAVDLVDQIRAQPRSTLTRLGQLLDDMQTGKLVPIPHRAYDFGDVRTAFRDLASARNIGKLVLTPRTTRPLVHADGAYIVTGGSAGVGFAAAEWLAAEGAARVILLGRREPTPDIADRIAAWRKKGVDISAVLGDAASAESIDAVVADAGTALRGVIHCANALDDAPAGELTWKRFETVMRPKAQGAWNLHRATAGRSLDFFVLFSSFAGLAGTRGGANYAAANVALDSLAHLRRHLGLPALSLNWGAWAEIGWAARRPGGAPALPGFNAMKPDRGINAMALAMRHARSAQVAIAPIDWPRLAATLGRNSASFLHDFVAPVTRGAAAAAGAQSSLADLIAATVSSEVKAAVVARIRIIAAGALGVDEPEQIDPDRALQDLGLDSILAVDMRGTLSHSLRRALPATLLFDYPTINSLAAYCIGSTGSERAAPAAARPEPSGVDLLELIEGLSDAEVDERLLTRGAELAS